MKGNYNKWLEFKIKRSALNFEDWKYILKTNKEGLKVLKRVKKGGLK